MNELILLKQQFEVIAQSGEQYPINFDDAWQWVGYARKDPALRTLKANFEEGFDFDSTLKWDQDSRHGGDRRSVKYHLTTDCFLKFCLRPRKDKAVRDE